MKYTDEFTLYDLQIEIVQGDKPFVCSHQSGIACVVEGENLLFTQKKFSLYSLAAILPLLPAKQRQTHANDWMTTDADIACPDPNCGARFRITRKNKRSFRHSETTIMPLKGKII